MAEVYFYHLTRSNAQQTLADLLAKSLQRGWRALVRGTDASRLKMMDDWLWQHPEDGFLPHAIDNDCDGLPVLLTSDPHKGLDRDVLILVDEATVKASEINDFARVCVIFDGNDPEAMTSARQLWTSVSQSGTDAVYWSQESGKWQQKIHTAPPTVDEHPA